ncbi:MAG TPA: 30S ribosomal protein S9 [Bacteroidia bacterium]|jgi:small subunit ribosomal protein S9
MDVIITLGRRKTAVARVYMKKGKGAITINGRDYKDFFKTGTLQYKIVQPFALTNNTEKYDVTANVDGGGINGQADAVRLGISKALVEVDANNKPALRAATLMTRDPRMVERKKPGQKKARKRFQFSKR